MTAERLDVPMSWETSGVDRGLERVEKAFDRLDKAEQKAVKQQQQRELDAARQSLKAAEQSIKDETKLRKEAHDERVRLTQDEYKRIETLNRNHQANIVQGMRQMQARMGISSSGSAAGRAAGGHGGHGGGGLLGGQTRMIGDMLDNVTGTQGWVMKLRALEHLGPALGRMLPIAGGAAAIAGGVFAGFRHAGQQQERGDDLRKAMGEGFESPWMTNPFTKGLMSHLPAWMRPDPTMARPGAQSAEGMSQQRQEIRAALEKERAGRGGFGGFAQAFAQVATGWDVNSSRYFANSREASFGREERAEEKLRGIDSRQAGLVTAGAEARRIGTFVDPFQGEMAHNELEMQQRRAALMDQANSGAIGIEQYHAGIKAAESDRAGADFESNRKDDLRGNALYHDQWREERRAAGDSPRVMAEIRLEEAKKAQPLAVGDREQQAAKTKVLAAQTDLDIAARDEEIRRKSLSIDYEQAKLRGNSEENARASVEAAQTKARVEYEALMNSKEATFEQRKQAAIALEQANTAAVMLHRQQEIAIAKARSSDREANIRFRSDAGVLGQGSVAHERAGLQANVDLARERMALATEQYEKDKGSLASLEAMHAAQAGIAEALLKQKGYEIELARSRREQLGTAQVETAALRLQNGGRGEEAAMLTARRSSDEAQYNAYRENNPEMAHELATQQQARETGAYLGHYYNADGTRKDRGKLNRQEQLARQTQGRRDRAAARFERDGGLINVTRDIGGHVLGGVDPFTHQHVTAAQMRARLNDPAERAKRDGEQKGSLADIYKVLAERLPPAK